MSHRDARIADASIMSSLQNGAAFFASTSLIILGGAAAAMRRPTTYQSIRRPSIRPDSDAPNWELKVLGLAFIFGYSFFKFAWAYRLFIYAAILHRRDARPPKPRRPGARQARRSGRAS